MSSPRDDEAVREAYRSQMPEPRAGAPLSEYEAEVHTFTATDPDSVDHDLADVARAELGKTPMPITSADFEQPAARCPAAMENAIERFRVTPTTERRCTVTVEDRFDIGRGDR